MIDTYFKRPILWDYLITLIIISIIAYFQFKGFYSLPTLPKVISVTNDIGTIGLTVSGFIITIITILLTLRSGQILSEEDLKNDSPPFKIFLASPLYSKSIKILKYGVYSLVIVAICSYILKMAIPECYLQYLQYFNVLGLIVIVTTFLRSFYVLGMILKMQDNK
jgi:hypothetical protein